MALFVSWHSYSPCVFHGKWQCPVHGCIIKDQGMGNWDSNRTNCFNPGSTKCSKAFQVESETSGQLEPATERKEQACKTALEIPSCGLYTNCVENNLYLGENSTGLS